jgi:two-component system sensor histidine kinase HydH
MDRGGRLTVSAHPSDGRLVIGIEDTGRGIPACDIPHVFNPYFTHRKNGTGLGLAIVHKIVESHNGTVHITSRENEGTTVSVSLPIQNERILK